MFKQNTNKNTRFPGEEMWISLFQSTYGKNYKKVIKICNSFASFIVTLPFVVLEDQYDQDIVINEQNVITGHLYFKARNMWQYNYIKENFEKHQLSRVLNKRKIEVEFLLEDNFGNGEFLNA